MDRSDLSNLTAFVAVADRRSFRAAASQLGVTPSALSHSMRQLEERLGLRLLAQRIGRLNRRPHGVSHFQNALILFERPKSPNMPPSIRLHPTLVWLPRMGYLALAVGFLDAGLFGLPFGYGIVGGMAGFAYYKYYKSFWS
jgi:Bacterial regulatory helix-turn-helix protein, lysR family